MTETDAEALPARGTLATLARPVPSAVPGIAVAGALAVIATVAGDGWPVLGAPVIAVVLGALLSPFVQRFAVLASGLGLVRGRLLQVAVVLLGAQLSLRQVATTGVRSLPVLASTLLVCFALAHLVGRRLGVDTDLRTLIAVGTGICGASAIAAVSPVIRAKSADIAYAISTIFLFNVAAVLVFPPIGHALGLSQHAFGLFAGTAVNDTSSVVAAASSYGTAAAGFAVIVKLTRTLAIIPITLTLGARRGHDVERALLHRIWRLVPWFLVGFVLVVVGNTFGAVPASAHAPLRTLDTFLVTMALAAIGLSTDAAGLRRAGVRPLLLGLLLWVAVTITSLGVGAVSM